MGTIHFQNSIVNIIYCEYLRTIHNTKNVVVSINTFIFSFIYLYILNCTIYSLVILEHVIYFC